MSADRSLEEDILNVLWRSFGPLNALEIWDELQGQQVDVPVTYLDKVLRAMTRVQLLAPAGERAGNPAYRTAISSFGFYGSPLKAIQIPSIRRKPVAILENNEAGKTGNHFLNVLQAVMKRLLQGFSYDRYS